MSSRSTRIVETIEIGQKSTFDHTVRIKVYGILRKKKRATKIPV